MPPRDGAAAYRLFAYVADSIRTRNGHDWTARFPTIARDAAALKVRAAVLDGASLSCRSTATSNGR